MATPSAALAGALLFSAGLLVAGSVAGAQTAPLALRLAFLPDWVVEQHRTLAGAARAELRAALDDGVVDRPVFAWRPGAVHRQTLGAKPVRVVPGSEAAALGGHGEFRLAALRPPAGASAWTLVEVTGGSAPEDVLVLEVGGELAPVQQVLASLLVGAPDGSWVELRLARRALFTGAGVPVVTAPAGRPLARADGPGLLRGTAGLGFLVVRSPIDLDTVPNGAMTSRGLADLAPPSGRGADWREGDRVYLRVPLATLRAGVPAIVLAWKDRVLKEDGSRDQWESGG